jgi:hypothetical protein
MKSTKIGPSRNRNLSRHIARTRRARRKPASMRKQVVDVVLAGTTWDPMAVASALAAIGSSTDGRSIAQIGAMPAGSGQLVLLWIDEQPQRKAEVTNPSTTSPTPREIAVPRQDVIATD